jgi:phospholipase C
MFESFIEAVSDGADAVASAASELKEDLEDAWEDLTGDAEDTFNDAAEQIESAAQDQGFLGAVVAVIGAAVAVGVGLIGNAVDFGANVIGAAGKAVFAMGGAALGTVARVLVGAFTGGGDSKEAVRAWSFFANGGRELGERVESAAEIVGQLAERANDIVADIATSITRTILCWMTESTTGASGQQGLKAIDHFLVLMLENRSFDHMLGHFQGLDGLASGNYFNNANDGSPCAAGARAPFMLEVDCPHEFPEVDYQLHGDPLVLNGGFVKAYEQKMAQEGRPNVDRTAPMRAFSAETLPVMHALAREFAVCDRWFSSLPGPTLPNRQFVHAATSGGMADSPNNVALGAAMPIGGFEFENGTIFDRLDSKCIRWRIHAGDLTPLVMTLRGIASDSAVDGWPRVGSIDSLLNDLAGAGSNLPNYIFIEPNYGRFWSDYHGGNSQHPLDSTTGGEALIKSIYEALRSSMIWNRAALLVLYDEHGGFYDHVEAPSAQPPGDQRRYESWSASEQARRFGFDRLGVRVPALVVSPWVDKGVVDHTVYDHSSVVGTLAKRFGLRSLTRRDASANTLAGLFSRTSPRTDTPTTLPTPAGPYS